MTNQTTLLHDQPRVTTGCAERVAAPGKNPTPLVVLEVLQTHKASTALFGLILVHIAYSRCLPLYNLVAFKKLDESTDLIHLLLLFGCLLHIGSFPS